ncbi:hypothetical protein GCM10027346_38860 [Hymenobacter seoulensis]
MVHVQRERLTDSFLLILTEGGPGPEFELERALYRGVRSGKPAIWIDCSQLAGFSEEAADLLLAYQGHLPTVGIELVLSHVSEVGHQALRRAAHRDPLPRVVLSLLDAPTPPPPGKSSSYFKS